MPRKLSNAAQRIQLDGGSIFRYSYTPCWTLDATSGGKRMRVKLCRDQREAISKAQKILDNLNKAKGSGAPAMPENVTLRQVADAYLAKRRSKLGQKYIDAPRSNRSYRIDEDRLNELLRRLPVSKASALRKHHCHRFVDEEMARQSKNNPKKTVGRNTAIKPVRQLVTALEYAASIDLCQNPLSGIVLEEAKGEEVRKVRRAMTRAEYEAFLRVSIDRDVRIGQVNHDRIPQTPVYMAIYESGRRREEMFTLEWPAVHLGGTAPTWEFFETKGEKLARSPRAGSERYAIPPRVLPYLYKLRDLHERRLGRKVWAGDLVFLSAAGCPLHGKNLLDDFYVILEQAGIPRFDHRGRSLDLHAARTTVYARGAEAGIPVDQMMEFVGHKDIRTALNHYRDPAATNTQRIAAKLAALARTETPSVPAAEATATAASIQPTGAAPVARVGKARSAARTDAR